MMMTMVSSSSFSSSRWLLLLSFVLGGVCASESASHPSAANCTWKYIQQPLSHFERAQTGYYNQRLCVYEGYWKANQSLPVFLYTGNESPVEEYVNNTGLMWELAEKYSALVIFAEHRYFGESIPKLEGVNQCIAYLSSEEALADYASLSNRVRREWGAENSAIIAFGGSYGGMLASWLRILYPSAVDGAIAASAPVWGFPLNSCPLDGSAQTVTYAASPAAGAAPLCADNLKASYVLISDIGSTKEGRKQLSDAMNLCTPLSSAADVQLFLSYLQTPLFDLAEGSYPFATDYITFALTGSTDPLPPWAMQVMCEPLGEDFGVKLSGDTHNVVFDVNIGDVVVHVDWEKTTNNGYNTNEVQSSGALDLAASVAQSVQIWYNVSGNMPTCVDWKSQEGVFASRRSLSHNRYAKESVTKKSRSSGNTESEVCTATTIDAMTAWNVLTCNEGINLVNWWAQGVGNDLYWPPNQARGYSRESLVPGSLAYCEYLGGVGLFGVPAKRDDWSFWLDTAYGGTRMQYVSNIVYSNGNLDPWMPAGVSTTESVEDSVASLIIEMGGHHLDLFFATEEDPESVRYVRKVEEEHIKKWINQVAQSTQKHQKHLH